VSRSLFRRRLLRTTASLVVLTASTACSGAVALTEPDPDAAGRATCMALLTALPEQVLQSTRRPTRPGVLTRSWGDPPITLRCGVARPPALTASSECLEVDGVGWFNEDAQGGVLFTTVGRAVFVEVGVPHAYAPEVRPLTDLAAAVSAHDPLAQPCR
jgi:hypothetical protein